MNYYAVVFLLRPPTLRRGPFSERENVCNSQEKGVRARCAAIVNHPAVLKILRVVNLLRLFLVWWGPLGGSDRNTQVSPPFAKPSHARMQMLLPWRTCPTHQGVKNTPSTSLIRCGFWRLVFDVVSIPINRNRPKIAAISDRKVQNRKFCCSNRRKLPASCRKNLRKIAASSGRGKHHSVFPFSKSQHFRDAKVFAMDLVVNNLLQISWGRFFLENMQKIHEQIQGSSQTSLFKPGCLQFLCRISLLHSFAPFCALLRSFALFCALLRPFALFGALCALFALF